MMYYAFELDDDSKELATTVTPFGKFQYCRFAMGLKISPDEAQSIIKEILDGLDLEVYIDDIGIFSNDYDEHLHLIDTVLERLEQNDLKVNPLKCEWAVEETDFLGHWLTPTGVKAWKKKVDAILKMRKPQDLTQLRSFLGAVTYYRTMWPRRSHVLAPLTALTGKRKFEWSAECDTAFEEMNAIMSSDVLMRYPNHNLPFDIYTDASDYQMGAVIMQKNKPVAYWSRKFNDAQSNYGTIEKELLAVVECLKEFRTMLLGANITIYTDHRNLTFRTLNTQRVLRWRLSLEDFAPIFRYIEGKDNVIADCFSRLPRMDKPSEGKNADKIERKGKLIAFDSIKVPPVPDEAFSYEETVKTIRPPSEKEVAATMPCLFSCCRDQQVIDDEEMFESYLNHPRLEEMHNPITMQSIQLNQFEDDALNRKRQRNPYQFPIKTIGGRNIICCRQGPNAEQWVIALPTKLVDDVIIWYHKVLGHCGNEKMYQTIRERLFTPGLWQRCSKYRCRTCQLNKQVGVGYGHLPPREANVTPWAEVASDLIGPWPITLADGREVKFMALTSIDLATNLTELVRIKNKTAAHVSKKFEQIWLNRYPKPNRCIHDNGGEFRAEWLQLMERAGIENVPTTSRNPQSNAICERMHQTVGNILRTMFNDGRDRPQTMTITEEAVHDALSSAMHIMRCAVSKALGDNTPGAVAFHRDMLMDIPVLADLETIRTNRQHAIDNNLMRQNNKRYNFDYAVNGEVLIKTIDPTKMDARAHGPYIITRVYANGTVDIRRNQHVIERINIRRLIPFKRWNRAMSNVHIDDDNRESVASPKGRVQAESIMCES